MHRMGHSSARAALIYIHATTERDQALAAALNQVVEQVRPRARTDGHDES